MTINSLTQVNAKISTAIDGLLADAIKQGDADQAFKLCNDLLGIQRISGLSLAKTLWTIHQHWNEFGIDDDFFDNAALRLDIHRHTIERYVKVHHMMITDVPADVIKELQDHNIRDLIPIANAISQGYTITNETWDKIADADDSREIARIIREDVKGVEPKSGSITLWMDRDGTLWAFHDEERHFVGSLEVAVDDEIIQKAINRIISNTGITKQ
jgi:hypothetical protein